MLPDPVEVQSCATPATNASSRTSGLPTRYTRTATTTNTSDGPLLSSPASPTCVPSVNASPLGAMCSSPWQPSPPDPIRQSQPQFSSHQSWPALDDSTKVDGGHIRPFFSPSLIPPSPWSASRMALATPPSISLAPFPSYISDDSNISALEALCEFEETSPEAPTPPGNPWLVTRSSDLGCIEPPSREAFAGMHVFDGRRDLQTPDLSWRESPVDIDLSPTTSTVSMMDLESSPLSSFPDLSPLTNLPSLPGSSMGALQHPSSESGSNLGLGLGLMPFEGGTSFDAASFFACISECSLASNDMFSDDVADPWSCFPSTAAAIAVPPVSAAFENEPSPCLSPLLPTYQVPPAIPLSGLPPPPPFPIYKPRPARPPLLRNQSAPSTKTLLDMDCSPEAPVRISGLASHFNRPSADRRMAESYQTVIKNERRSLSLSAQDGAADVPISTTAPIVTTSDMPPPPSSCSVPDQGKCTLDSPNRRPCHECGRFYASRRPVRKKRASFGDSTDELSGLGLGDRYSTAGGGRAKQRAGGGGDGRGSSLDVKQQRRRSEILWQDKTDGDLNAWKRYRVESEEQLGGLLTASANPGSRVAAPSRRL